MTTAPANPRNAHPPRSSADPAVAIVGAGPVGLALAALLDRHGITSRVYERRCALHRDPQAHVVNTRSMEILRELGIEHAVQAAAAPPMLMRSITWCESLAGREFGRLRLQGDNSGGLVRRLALSPTSIANLAQNLLEPLLHDVVAGSARSEVCFDRDVTDVAEDAGGVRLRVREPDGSVHEHRASFLVACDGAGSGVRRQLGIEMIGPTSLQKFVSVYFEADLRRWIGDRPGPVYWIAGARTRGAMIGFDLVRTWALMVPYGEPHTSADFTDEIARRMVLDAIGDPAATVRITSIGKWNMSAQVAERYRSGRVFLAGDAAHRFPPSGGLGMNTGIQDAHNLAWKLAAVLHGTAGDALLDTYQSERHDVAHSNCDQSVRNAFRMMEVDMVLGTPTLAPVDPGPLARDETVTVDYGMDGDGDAAVAKRQAVQQVIDAQAEHFDFGGLDLGFRYETGAVIPDGTEAPPLDVQVYTPVARPGSRLPHVWLTRLGRRVSTLDVARPGRFTLLTDADGGAWVCAVRERNRTTAPALGVAVIAGDAAEAGAYGDADGAWAAVRGTGPGGAVLVRPDGHVAWRAATAPAGSGEAFDALCDVFDTLLALPTAARAGKDAA